MAVEVLITKMTHCGKLYAYYYLPYPSVDERTTRTMVKTYSTFCLYSLLGMQKIVNSRSDKKIKITKNKS
jgi:hypothetical protein